MNFPAEWLTWQEQEHAREPPRYCYCYVIVTRMESSGLDRFLKLSPLILNKQSLA